MKTILILLLALITAFVSAAPIRRPYRKPLKPARVETGAEIRVPLFIEEGEIVEVDSRDGSYLGRVKA